MKRSLLGLYLVTLSVGDAPPDEFRIFKPGINPTRKGPVVFDDVSAKSVMAAYDEHGTDIMVDLEHLSLDDTARNYDPDARAWLKLEVRKGPELWATSVRWTPDGEARLKAKRQRYISPAMRVDTKSRRVLELVNIALCGMPATDNLTPLVASRARTAANKGTPVPNPKLLAALGLSDDATDDDVSAAIAEAMKDPAKMAALIAAAFGCAAPADGGDGGMVTDAMKPGEGAPAPKPGAAPPGGGAPPQGTAKKVTTEYHKDDAMAAELLALKAQVNANTIRETIAANRTKFTPALESWALKAFAHDPDGLTVWLKAQPVLAAPKSTEKQAKSSGGAGGSTEVKLTQADLEVCRLTGRDPKAFLAHKRELAAADNGAALTSVIDEET